MGEKPLSGGGVEPQGGPGKVAVVVRRIVVGLDGSPPSLGALEAAVELAGAFEADLEGLFVEEDAWHRVVTLGTTGVIGGYTGGVRSLGAGELSGELRAVARRLAALLEAASARLAREARFRVERGRAEAILLEAAEGADLITVGCVGLSPGRAGRLGRSARALAERSSTPILFLAGRGVERDTGGAGHGRAGGARGITAGRAGVPARPGAVLGRRVVVVGNGEEEGADALALAAELALRRDVGLEVVAIKGKHPGGGAGLAGLGAIPEGSKLHLVPELTAASVARVMGPARDALLVVPRGSRLFEDASLEALIGRLRVPVLLV